MPVIDADTHLIETEQTWDFMDKADAQFRPIIVTPKGEGGKQYWFIDGKIRGNARTAVTAQDVHKLEETLGRKMDAPDEAREGGVEARLKHMDQLGVDVQVLWPTVFLEKIADRAEAEVAVCRGYNRWLGEIWRQGGGRLRWVSTLPFLSIPDALDELHWAKDHGAVGMFMRGIEGERLMHDPYFFPLYEALERNNMVVGVHAGNANPYVRDLLQQRNNPGTFWAYRMTAIGAFHSLIMTGLPDKFPNLRFSFVELAAQWVPWALKDAMRRLPQQRGRFIADNPMKAYRMYVACQTDDDVAYIAKYAGEDNLVMGTDYGHHDHAADLEGLRKLKDLGDISPTLYRKIVDENPRALYGL